MSKSLSTEEAISILVEDNLNKLTKEERREQLEIMMYEDWESDPSWSNISPEVQKDFAEEKEIQNPLNEKYDLVLKLWLRTKYSGARNSYILEKIKLLNSEIIEIVGETIELLACPCCGYKTLGEHGNYEICTVCWWEDDGQDNSDASQILGGPNYGMSLTRSRINFLRYGIYDPSRKDLLNKREATEKFMRGRVFVLNSTKEIITEPATGWKAQLSDEK